MGYVQLMAEFGAMALAEKNGHFLGNIKTDNKTNSNNRNIGNNTRDINNTNSRNTNNNNGWNNNNRNTNNNGWNNNNRYCAICKRMLTNPYVKHCKDCAKCHMIGKEGICWFTYPEKAPAEWKAKQKARQQRPSTGSFRQDSHIDKPSFSSSLAYNQYT